MDIYKLENAIGAYMRGQGIGSIGLSQGGNLLNYDGLILIERGGHGGPKISMSEATPGELMQLEQLADLTTGSAAEIEARTLLTPGMDSPLEETPSLAEARRELLLEAKGDDLDNIRWMLLPN